jgi:hypothetical protein
VRSWTPFALALLVACGTGTGARPDGGPLADGGIAADGGAPKDGGVADGGSADGGTTFASFEACCGELGCATAGDMEWCAAYEPAYGRCTIDGRAGLCIDTARCAGSWSPTPGFCPGPAQIQCCRPPASTCTDADHPLPNRGIAPVVLDPRCPPGMRAVGDTHCVDAWESFLVEELPDGGVADWSPYFNPGSRRMRAVSAEGAVPQGYINGIQAAAACARAGKRLCTDAEWLRACRGPAGWVYPYGDTREPRRCNDSRSVHPAYEYFGTTDPSVFSRLGHPCLNQLDGGLARTGAYAGCITAEGLSDMMGNLHEWTSDPAGTFRGGFYVDTRLNGEGCLYVTTAHDRSHWDYSTGFRCCAEVRP